MARQNRVTVAWEVPVRRPSSAAEQCVTAAGSSRISSPTFRREAGQPGQLGADQGGDIGRGHAEKVSATR